MTTILLIDYVVTHDDPVDGDAILPGVIDDGVFWALVQRVNGCALWRRIYLKQNSNTSTPRGARRWRSTVSARKER